MGDATTYGPSSGARFLTRDPLEALTRSAYGYAYNNPLNFTDPTGLGAFDFLGGIGDFFTGGGCGDGLLGGIGDALGGATDFLGDVGSSLLDNSFVRGIAATIVVSSLCASTAGVGCLLLVGGAAGSGLSLANYYVNDKNGGLGGHLALGLISGSTSGLMAGTWGMAANAPTQGAFTFFRSSVPGTIVTASVAQRGKLLLGGAASWLIGG